MEGVGSGSAVNGQRLEGRLCCPYLLQVGPQVLHTAFADYTKAHKRRATLNPRRVHKHGAQQAHYDGDLGVVQR